MNTEDIIVSDYNLACAAGLGISEIRESIKAQKTGLMPNDTPHSGLPTYIGKIDALDNFTWQDEQSKWQSRNNALIKIALQQGSLKRTVESLQRDIPSQRIGLIVGSSTSSIDRSEQAYRASDGLSLPKNFQQKTVLNPHAPTLFAAEILNIKGPSVTINTACSSSAKVFACAARWIKLGIVDAVVVGGADSIGLSVLHGFHALQLISKDYCRPFDRERNGINLGEAAGFAVLTRRKYAQPGSDVVLLGYGESSDAHHMSHPHPEGKGALLAIEQALAMAKLKSSDIDYVNLHGTASQANDYIEGNLVGELFPPTTLCSSTKGWTGHTLGAAGIIESLFAIETMKTGLIPGTLHYQNPDPEINLKLFSDNKELDTKTVMSNSFGFGGNNSCLIFGHRSMGEAVSP